MAAHIKRELLFNVLCGSGGNRFLQSIIGTKQNGEIYDVNTWIKNNFKENFFRRRYSKAKLYERVSSPPKI